VRKLFRHYKYRILGFPKTLYFNLKYFGFKDGIKLPFMLSHRVILKKCEGKIIFRCPIRRGLVTWGYSGVSIATMKEYSVFNVEGTLTISGIAFLGSGTKIYIEKGGELILGNKFEITSNSSIICTKRIEFGSYNLLSWDILVMDTDAHYIYSLENEILINANTPIKLGNNVWVGCRTFIAKGTTIPDNTVIAANSVIRGKHKGENSVLANEHPIKRIPNIKRKLI